MNPAITVIIPYYRAAKTIQTTLASVLNQSFSNFEAIVVDDHSPEDDLNSVPEVEDSRVRVERLDVNAGPSTARNKGLELALGDVIAFLDADDLWHRDYLQRVSDTLKDPEVDIVCSRGYVFRNGKVVRPLNNALGSFNPRLIWSNQIGCPSGVALRKAAFQSAQFDEELRLYEDYLLYVQLASCRFQFTENYFFYRVEGQNFTSAYKQEFERSQQQKLREKLGYDQLSREQQAMVNAVTSSINYNSTFQKALSIFWQVLRSRDLKMKYFNYLRAWLSFQSQKRDLQQQLNRLL